MDTPVATGERAPEDRFVRTLETPRVRVGGRDATVQFSGLAPGWVALYQVNAMLPPGLAEGDVEIELEIAGRTARFAWERE